MKTLGNRVEKKNTIIDLLMHGSDGSFINISFSQYESGEATNLEDSAYLFLLGAVNSNKLFHIRFAHPCIAPAKREFRRHGVWKTFEDRRHGCATFEL